MENIETILKFVLEVYPSFNLRTFFANRISGELPMALNQNRLKMCLNVNFLSSIYFCEEHQLSDALICFPAICGDFEMWLNAKGDIVSVVRNLHSFLRLFFNDTRQFSCEMDLNDFLKVYLKLSTFEEESDYGGAAVCAMLYLRHVHDLESTQDDIRNACIMALDPNQYDDVMRSIINDNGGFDVGAATNPHDGATVVVAAKYLLKKFSTKLNADFNDLIACRVEHIIQLKAELGPNFPTQFAGKYFLVQKEEQFCLAYFPENYDPFFLVEELIIELSLDNITLHASEGNDFNFRGTNGDAATSDIEAEAGALLPTTVYYYNGHRVDISEIEPVENYYYDYFADRPELGYINPDFVSEVLKTFFVPNGYCVFDAFDANEESYKLKVRYDLKNNNNLKYLLATYTQNGKTDQMIAMIWVLFFRYGYGSYVFCRSDCQEYAVLTAAFENFNEKLMNHFRHRRDIRIHEYRIQPVPLSSMTGRSFASQDHYESSSRYLYCKCRIRILVASNVNSAVRLEVSDVLGKCYGKHESDKSRFRMAMFIDEAQNAIQSIEAQDGRYALQRAVKACSKLFAITVEISATQEASYLVNNFQSVELLFIPPKINYFGYGKRLAENRRIEIKALEESETGESLQSIKFSKNEDVVQKFLIGTISNELCALKPSHPTEHWICATPSTSNEKLDEYANSVISRTSNDCSGRAVIVVVAYAQHRDYGSTILFNAAAAREITLEDIIEAEGNFHCTFDEAMQLDSKCRRNNTKAGDNISVAEGGGYRIVVGDTRLTQGSKTSWRKISGTSGGYELRLPRRGFYRLRMQLSLVEELMKKKNRNFSILTIGDKLIKEGITPKTYRHTLAPNRMYGLYCSDSFVHRPLINLLQLFGRLCGLRDIHGAPPVLYLIKDCIEPFQSIVDFNESAMLLIGNYSKSIQKFSVSDILNTLVLTEGTGVVVHPIRFRQYVMSVWDRISQSSPQIKGMRKFISETFTNDTYHDKETFKIVRLMLKIFKFVRSFDLCEEASEQVTIRDIVHSEDSTLFMNETRETVEKSFVLMLSLINKNNSDASWISKDVEDFTEAFFIVNGKNWIRGNSDKYKHGLLVCTCASLCNDSISKINSDYCGTCTRNFHKICFKGDVWNGCCKQCRRADGNADDDVFPKSASSCAEFCSPGKKARLN